jgi:hypothetical protein
MIVQHMKRKPRIIIASFALCGLLIAAAIYVYYSFYNYTKPMNAFDAAIAIVMVVLCPPSLLSLLCIDCEVGTEAGLVWFSFIALLNCGLYAGIGALVLRHRKANG